MGDAELRCTCGEVHGTVKGASPDSVNRVVCYCADCQAYARHLGRGDLLDEHGGTDIIQVAPSALSFDRGAEKIAGVRLSAKGLHRWYASCCKTPVGNTMTPGVPFVGIVAQIFDDAESLFGKPTAGIHGKDAVGEPPPGSTKPPLRFLAGAARRIVGWRLGGGAWPHPFFDRATKKPIHPITTLTSSERDALRPRA